MKTFYKTFKIGTIILMALWMGSCSEFLDEDPKGQLASVTFFSEDTELDAGLNALYEVVANTVRKNNYTGTNLLAGDDISTHPASNKEPLREFDQYSVADNNSWMASVWKKYCSLMPHPLFAFSS